MIELLVLAEASADCGQDQDNVVEVEVDSEVISADIL